MPDQFFSQKFVADELDAANRVNLPWTTRPHHPTRKSLTTRAVIDTKGEIIIEFNDVIPEHPFTAIAEYVLPACNNYPAALKEIQHLNDFIAEISRSRVVTQEKLLESAQQKEAATKEVVALLIEVLATISIDRKGEILYGTYLKALKWLEANGYAAVLLDICQRAVIIREK